MRVALAQIDPTVGDIDGNAAKIAEWIARARAAGAELTIFPELCLPGYPAEDLYLKRHFLARQPAGGRGAGPRRRARSRPWSGSPSRPPGGGDARHAHNSLAVLADGAIEAVYRKNRLPNYAVFDEQRYFVPGTEPMRSRSAATRVGLTICEDGWVAGRAGADRGRSGGAR